MRPVNYLATPSVHASHERSGKRQAVREANPNDDDGDRRSRRVDDGSDGLLLVRDVAIRENEEHVISPPLAFPCLHTKPSDLVPLTLFPKNDPGTLLVPS